MNARSLVVLVWLFASAAGWGQQQAAVVRGQLMRGKFPAAYVEVTIYNQSMPRSLVSVSGQDGMYYIHNIPFGDYYLEVWINRECKPFVYPIRVGNEVTDVPQIDVSGLAESNAVLSSMQITLNTLQNDLDRDTRLEAWINKSGEREAAYLDVKHNGLANSSTRVFDVLPKSNRMTRSEVCGSWVQLRIAPRGNETWNFKCRVMLRFSDGTTYERIFDEVTLNQNTRQANLPL